MNKAFLWISVLLLLAGPGLAWGADIYIGNDTENAGKVMWKDGGWPSTLDNDGANTNIQAVILANAGKTLVLDGGTEGVTYTTTQLGIGNNIVFGSDDVTLEVSAEEGHNGTVLINATGVGHGIIINDDDNVVLRGFSIVGADETLIRIVDAENTEIDGITFPEQALGTAFILLVPSDGNTITSPYIHDCTFNGDKTTTAIDFSFAALTAGQTATISLPRIEHNTFNNVYRALDSRPVWASTDPVGTNNLSPDGLWFRFNTVNDTEHNALRIGTGLKSTTRTTQISYNTFNDIGETDVSNINALQLSWVRGAIIEWNIIDGVSTNSCDGAGIILDWAWTDNSYISDGNTVRFNTVRNANGNACDGKGISVYKGSDNIVEYNILLDNDIGIKLTNAESTGNVFYNNTASGNDVAAAYINASAPASTWKNNILESVGKGFHVYSSTDPTESYNDIYAGSNDITLDVTDLTDNPLLDANGCPGLTSLYEAGTDITGGYYFGNNFAIGYCDKKPGFLTPWKLPLSIGDTLTTPMASNGGRLSAMLYDYVYFGSDQLMFGTDAIYF